MEVGLVKVEILALLKVKSVTTVVYQTILDLFADKPRGKENKRNNIGVRACSWVFTSGWAIVRVSGTPEGHGQVCGTLASAPLLRGTVEIDNVIHKLYSALEHHDKSERHVNH